MIYYSNTIIEELVINALAQNGAFNSKKRRRKDENSMRLEESNWGRMINDPRILVIYPRIYVYLLVRRLFGF